MKKYSPILAGWLLLLAIQVYGVTKVGTTAASFLAIDVGPRGTGMGSAYVSLANDATAMYWNPAGIAKLNRFETTFCNTKWIVDLSFNYVGAVIPFGNLGNLGVNATFLTMDPIERTTEFYPDGTGEFFDAGSVAFGLSYARNLTDKFAIGMNAKYINERMYHSNAYGLALDFGALYHTGFHGLTFGLSITNYGTKMRLDGRDLQVQHDISPSLNGNNANINARLLTDRFDLPLMLRTGISMDVFSGPNNSKLTIAIDALHPSDDVEYVNIGGEYTFYDMFFLRAGYKELFAEASEQGLSFGGGIHYKVLGTTTLFFDYSYNDLGVFNVIHMFSVGLGL